jgi:hypothetical protein
MSYKKCECDFCTKDYPKYLEVLESKDLNVKNAAIKEYFENWQMCENDKDLLKWELNGKWPPPKDV